MEQTIGLKFFGGAGDVTGANFMLSIGDAGPRFLIDCGLFQGTSVVEKRNIENFPYNPAEADCLLVTHAHLDHIGRIPKLFRDGFRGKVFSTAPTRKIAEHILFDSLGVMRSEDPKNVFFDENNIRQALSAWKTVEYGETFELDSVKVRAMNAGHILGSTMWEFDVFGKMFVFSGDLGNSPSPLLPDTDSIAGADYLIMESVYGDRNHEEVGERRHLLEDVIEETIKRGGTLMIPAFSVEKTQEILYEVELMMENSRIPLVPVFLDSPLGIKITDVYRAYSHFLNKKVQTLIKTGNTIFHFPQLHLTMTTDESKAILRANPKKIIIAGSGMSTGGRILHHEKNYLSDPNSTLLLIGYQQLGSLGRMIQDGAKLVKIMGEQVPVRAKVANIFGYSSHKDSDHLLDFVNQAADTLKKVFVTMGEPHSSFFLAQRIRDYLGIDARAPELGEEVKIKVEAKVEAEVKS